MAHHHNELPDSETNPVIAIITIIITTIASIWASVALEVTHGLITIFFGVISCITVFFLNKFLKKHFGDKK
jgi:hypothetical protein